MPTAHGKKRAGIGEEHLELQTGGQRSVSDETQDEAGSHCRGVECIAGWAIPAATEYDLVIPWSKEGGVTGGYERTRSRMVV